MTQVCMCMEGYKIEREMERTKRDHERENEERMRVSKSKQMKSKQERMLTNCLAEQGLLGFLCTVLTIFL